MSTPISPTEPPSRWSLAGGQGRPTLKRRADDQVWGEEHAVLRAVEAMDAELAATQASDAELRAKPPWAGILNGLTGAL